MKKFFSLTGLAAVLLLSLVPSEGQAASPKIKGRNPAQQATCDESGQTIPAGISMGTCQICRAYSGGAFYMYMNGVATHDESQFLGQNGQQSAIFTLENVKKSYYYHIGAGDCGTTCQAN